MCPTTSKVETLTALSRARVILVRVMMSTHQIARKRRREGRKELRHRSQKTAKSGMMLLMRTEMI
jgi:hypothetical protein